MSPILCAICGEPVMRDPVLFRAESVHAFCELRARALEGDTAANTLWERLSKTADAVEWFNE